MNPNEISKQFLTTIPKELQTEYLKKAENFRANNVGYLSNTLSEIALEFWSDNKECKDDERLGRVNKKKLSLELEKRRADLKKLRDDFFPKESALIQRIQLIQNKLGQYPVMVDYDLDVAELVEMGAYDCICDDFIPVDALKSEIFPTTKAGKEEVCLHLIHFNRRITCEDAMIEFDKMGLRSANLRELLSFGINYPGVHYGFNVVAPAPIGESTVPEYSKHIAIIFDNTHARGVSISPDEIFVDMGPTQWCEATRFAGVPK